MRLIRIFFEKRDRAKYISHLDITRCLSRAFARTTIPVWYTEGFNPRIYMTFPLPLPLGYESSCESFDVKITQDQFSVDEIARQLNPVLPQGIRVLSAAEPVSKPEAITWADYIIRIPNGQPQALLEQFRSFAAQPAIPVIKKTKKAEKEMDLAPLVKIERTEVEEGKLLIALRLAAGINLNISPALLLEAFESFSRQAFDYTQIERLAILREDGSDFT